MNEQGKKKRGFWETCRIYFRRFRIFVWLVLLLLLSSIIYLNQVGLPGFVKEPLLQELRQRGLDLQFSRLRLRWYEGIVAEDVRFGGAESADAAQLTARQVRVNLNLRSLLRLKVRVEELALQEGRLGIPVQDAGGESELAFQNIHTQLKFLPQDQWVLENLTAFASNTKLKLSGTVTNASAVAEWPVFKGKDGAAKPSGGGLWQKRAARLAQNLQQLQFSATPEIQLQVQGDARDIHSFDVRLTVAARDAQTPWAAVSEGRLDLHLSAADSNGTSRVDLELDAATAETRWASVTNLQARLHLDTLETETNLVHGDVVVTARFADTRWARGSNVVASAEWVHSITNPVPIAGEGRLQCGAAETRWANVLGFELNSRLSLPEPQSLPRSDPRWAWWTNIQPYRLEWRCGAQKVQAAGSPIAVSALGCNGTWQAPGLAVESFTATVGQGGLKATAGLDVASRQANVTLQTDLDPHELAPALGERAQQFLKDLSLNRRPRAEARIALVLPQWAGSHTNWIGEVRSSLQAEGAFNLEAGGSYRQVQVTAIRSHFAYSNFTWHLPDLTVLRPEGRLTAEHWTDGRTQDFYWHAISTVDPDALRPLLPPKTKKGFDLLALSQPPIVQAEVTGSWRAPEQAAVHAAVALTNFAFRGESGTELQASLYYSNKVLRVLEPHIVRGAERLHAEGLTADFNADLVYLTNAHSTADPMVVARAIGPHIARAIEPYVFSNPPVAYVTGTIPMHGEEGADLRFTLEGGPFHWWRFNVPQISGRLHWQGLALTMRDMRARFYDGELAGGADFQFPKGKGCDVTCAMTVTNALLQDLMADVSTGTNRLEGRLNGTLNFTRLNTTNWYTLFGHGEVTLRDGLIWDIPLFGIFTPVLNGISPGLGNTRASAGTCTYYITNGVIRTDDLEIHSPAMRLQYRGSVDIDSRVQARVEAELLRNMWLVGPIISTVLWPVTKMFEYRVSGTLGEPETQPVYIVPKIMFLPFRPIRTLKSLVPGEGSRTNAPPEFKAP